MNDIELEEIINKIKKTKDPINIHGEIEDLSNFIEIASDGNFCSRGFKYYWNPMEYQLIYFNWSNWEGELSTYQKVDLEHYLLTMLSFRDNNHFFRFVEGLKTILNIK